MGIEMGLLLDPGIESILFAALWLLLLRLGFYCGAFEMVRGTGCADAVKRLLTLEAQWMMLSL